MGVIEKEINDLKRLDEILHIFYNHEMGIILDKLDLEDRIPLIRRYTSERDKIPAPKRLRSAFEQLGPTFIKFGQIMAQRPDIVPQRYIEELEKLEDSVKVESTVEIKQIIEQDLGPIEENFEEFNEQPLAAASIAQVHEATLKTGEEVVIKVRRPRIKEKVEKDLDIMNYIAKRGENKVEKLQKMRISKLVEEFGKWIKEEMDLQKEARNADIIRENMADQENVKIPKIHHSYTSERVLVMEKVNGIKCTDSERLEELDLDIKEITRNGIRMGLRQVLRDGFFHADPHPSNFLIKEDGTIILIDFGMVGRLTKDTRRKIGLLFLHIANEDTQSALNVIREIAHTEHNADIEGFREDIEEMILMLRNTTIQENSLSRTLFDIVIRASNRGLYMPTNLVLTGKTLVTIEGILLTINPEAQITDEYQDEVQKILKQQNSPKELGKTFMIDLIQNKDLITKAPTKLNQLAEKEKTEKQEIHIENDASSNSQNILVASMVIATAILLSTTLDQEPIILLSATLVIVAALLYRNK